MIVAVAPRAVAGPRAVEGESHEDRAAYEVTESEDGPAYQREQEGDDSSGRTVPVHRPKT
jgi:hypothetical protein